MYGHECVNSPTFGRRASRDDPKIRAKQGKRAGWYTGANSTCRRHIASFHYQVYHDRCKEKNLDESKEAIPKAVKQAREEEAAEAAKQ